MTNTARKTETKPVSSFFLLLSVSDLLFLPTFVIKTKCLISCVQRVHALSPSTFYQAPLSSCTAEVNQILQHAATPERVPEVVALSHRKPPPPLLNGKYRKQPQGAQGASAPDTEPTEIISCDNNWVLSGMCCELIQDQIKHCNRYADMSGLSLWKQGWQLAVDGAECGATFTLQMLLTRPAP